MDQDSDNTYYSDDILLQTTFDNIKKAVGSLSHEHLRDNLALRKSYS